MKKEDKKKRKTWKERRGLVSRVCDEIVPRQYGNRKDRRYAAREYIKDPLNTRFS